MVVKDGVEVKQDNSSANQKQTSYTEEQVREIERKARSDALAEAGRFKAEAEKASKAAQASLDRINKMEQERLNAELEANKDDPAEIKRIRAEQRATKAEAELADREQKLREHEEAMKAVETERAEAKKSTLSAEIARKYNVDADKLAKLAKRTDGSQEAIEELASELPRMNKSTFRPDSNRSIGGILTWEEVRDAYIKNPYDTGNKQRYNEMKSQGH